MSAELSKPNKGQIAPLQGRDGAYMVMSTPADVLADVIQANLVPGEVSLRDLPMVKVPSGEMDHFMFPTEDGVKAVKEFSGVIVGSKSSRAFWREAIQSGHTPPDCMCDDCASGSGVGEPGGPCGQCPMNEWGSAQPKDGKPSKGKACSEKRMLLVFVEGMLLPLVLVVPPTSLKGASKHMMKLSSFGKPFWSVETKFRLAKAGSGQHCVIEFDIASRLTPEQTAFFAERHDDLKPFMAASRSAAVENAPIENDGAFDD
jgi:hypothetical protein